MYSKKKKFISVNNNATTHVQNNICSELEVTFCSKDNEKRKYFIWTAFMIDYISTYKLQVAIMELDLEADQPRMNVEVRVTMAEL